MKLEFSRRIFEKSSNTKFLENRSSGSRVFHADIETGGGHTDLTKLIVSFRNCAKTPKKEMRLLPSHHVLTLYQDDDVSVSWRGFWLGTRLTAWLTDWLTVWLTHSTNLFRKIQELPHICRTRRYITMCTRNHHCSVFSVQSMQSRFSRPAPSRTVSILLSHIYLSSRWYLRFCKNTSQFIISMRGVCSVRVIIMWDDHVGNVLQACIHFWTDCTTSTSGSTTLAVPCHWRPKFAYLFGLISVWWCQGH
jgi:hypothetical protein